MCVTVQLILLSDIRLYTYQLKMTIFRVNRLRSYHQHALQQTCPLSRNHAFGYSNSNLMFLHLSLIVGKKGEIRQAI